MTATAPATHDTDTQAVDEPGAVPELPRTLVTSPLFFAHERQGGQVSALGLSRRERLRALHPRAWDLLYFFLDPRPATEATDAGYHPDELAQALAAGLLEDAGAPRTRDMFRWEDHRWSRAAYALYSQLDLPYTEPVEEGHRLPALSDLRREEISRFQSDRPYPPRFRVEPKAVHPLPAPAEPFVQSLDSMLARRSARKFAATPVTLDDLGALLYHSAANVRMAEDSKAGGDPYYLLNSFYTWLQLYVVVQGVEGVPRGVYQYDFAEHALLETGLAPDDAEIAATIQGQNWIGGGGVSLYVTVQWERYQWLYRHSRAYLNLLIQVGEFAQEVLQAAYQLGLVGWLTPAVAESRAARMLGLDQVPADADAMYYLKLGYPR
ncbi:hypothetical protein ADL22_23040 [Streptomyces sp. NRRL F-4489]|uniref:SagB/ThcOx family dehydrogenase n=1 Tax=Streptomyces sp. NRRL F-4489 TaxID=1609095 RepID=UPI000746EDDE|nr:SagB/ThcOx family dehydrogenase [Streptomyces sp. NRRL F-4489]KUL36997.1 hypothetical protein ADL22_23040 [Streptomyces sp. NRRL F-4489]